MLARDLAWLQTCGVAVTRHGLADDRGAFQDNALVRLALETDGNAALPLVLVDDTIISAGAYPSRPELARALGLSTMADDDYVARILASGTALGLAVASHDAAAIEHAYTRLMQIGVSRAGFTQSVRELLATPPSVDPQVAEALDRLAAYGTLHSPRGSCGCSPRERLST